MYPDAEIAFAVQRVLQQNCERPPSKPSLPALRLHKQKSSLCPRDHRSQGALRVPKRSATQPHESAHRAKSLADTRFGSSGQYEFGGYHNWRPSRRAQQLWYAWSESVGVILNQRASAASAASTTRVLANASGSTRVLRWSSKLPKALYL